MPPGSRRARRSSADERVARRIETPTVPAPSGTRPRIVTRQDTTSVAAKAIASSLPSRPARNSNGPFRTAPFRSSRSTSATKPAQRAESPHRISTQEPAERHGIGTGSNTRTRRPPVSFTGRNGSVPITRSVRRSGCAGTVRRGWVRSGKARSASGATTFLESGLNSASAVLAKRHTIQRAANRQRAASPCPRRPVADCQPRSATASRRAVARRPTVARRPAAAASEPSANTEGRPKAAASTPATGLVVP